MFAITYGKFNISKENMDEAAIKREPNLKTTVKVINAMTGEEMEGHKTPYVFTKYSPFPNGKYLEDKKRTFLKVVLDNGEDNNNELIKKLIEEYTNALDTQKLEIFDNKRKTSEKYKYSIIKIPTQKKNAYEEDDDDDDNGKTQSSQMNQKKLIPYLKIDLCTKFARYYNEEKLDYGNIKIINSKIFDGKQRSRDELKTHIAGLSFKLHVPNGSQNTTLVPMSEIVDRLEFDVVIYYREIQEKTDNMKHPQLCSPSELNEIYGFAKKINVSTIAELEKYCTGYSYYSYGFYAKELNANKEELKVGTIPFNIKIKFICKTISIIHVKGSFVPMKPKFQSIMYDDDNDEENESQKELKTVSTEEIKKESVKETKKETEKELKTPTKENKPKEELKTPAKEESEDEETESDDDDEEEESDDESEEPVVVVQKKTPPAKTTAKSGKK